MRRLICCVLMLYVFCTPALGLAGDGPHQHQKKKHSGLGLAVGLTTGIILGGWAASHVADDYDDEGTFMLTWTALAAAGAIAGYAVGGGFSKDEAQAAMDQNRQQVRQHSLADLDLSLSPIPELDLSQGLLLAEIHCVNTTADGC